MSRLEDTYLILQIREFLSDICDKVASVAKLHPLTTRNARVSLGGRVDALLRRLMFSLRSPRKKPREEARFSSGARLVTELSENTGFSRNVGIEGNAVLYRVTVRHCVTFISGTGQSKC